MPRGYVGTAKHLDSCYLGAHSFLGSSCEALRRLVVQEYIPVVRTMRVRIEPGSLSVHEVEPRYVSPAHPGRAARRHLARAQVSTRRQWLEHRYCNGKECGRPNCFMLPPTVVYVAVRVQPQSGTLR